MTFSATTRAYGFALLTYAFFSTHDAFVKAITAHMSVFQIIFFSSLFAMVPLSIMMLADKNVGHFRPRHPWYMALRTGLSLVALSSAFFAFSKIPLAEAYALLFVTPILITSLSVPLLGEHVGLRRWIAVIVGLFGVVLVLRPGVQEMNSGHLAALISALSSALAIIILRKVGNVERSAVMVLVPTLAGIVVMGLLMPWVYVPVELPELGILAILGTLVVGAQIFMIAAYRIAPSAAVVAPAQYTQILWATLFGALFFNEYPDKWVFAGAAVIIGSGLFILWRDNHAHSAHK